MADCNCKYCERREKVRDLLTRLSDEDKSFVEDLVGTLDCTELDLHVAHAVIDGSWSNADEWIERARQ